MEVVIIVLNAVLVISMLAIAWLIQRVFKLCKILIDKRFESHQQWLFNQLYSMAPGKVLKPDEVEEESEDTPAVVIHTNRDPMREFQGKRDDWRE